MSSERLNALISQKLFTAIESGSARRGDLDNQAWVGGHICIQVYFLTRPFVLELVCCIDISVMMR